MNSYAKLWNPKTSFEKQIKKPKKGGALLGGGVNIYWEGGLIFFVSLKPP
jgi:hypothetical protein